MQITGPPSEAGLHIKFQEAKVMDKNSFIAAVSPGAVAGMHAQGILASVSVAQAILESGWGSHAPGNNLFGIKANGWKGKTQQLTTTEYVKGRTVTIKAWFRAYDNWSASIEDHAAFLAGLGRYRNLIGQKDYRIVAQRLQADGYATEPNYAQQLIALVEQYGLVKYDGVPAPIVHIDSPKAGAVITGDILVRGWGLHSAGFSRADAWLDPAAPVKNRINLGTTGGMTPRPDVEKIYAGKGYASPEHSGIALNIPRGKLPKGKHTLGIAGIPSDGSGPVWALIPINVK